MSNDLGAGDVFIGNMMTLGIVGCFASCSGIDFGEPEYIHDQRTGLCFANKSVVECTPDIETLAERNGLVYKSER